MAKEQDKTKVEAAPKTDFVQLVKDSTQAMGLSSFVRVNLDKHVTDEGLEALTEEYEKQGYEVFSNKKSVVLLKQQKSTCSYW